MPLSFWDFVLPAILLLFIPLGFWRGLIRELLTFVGISLASVTVLLWTPSWVRVLSNTFRADLPSLQVAAQIGGFAAITLIAGYGSSLLPLRFPTANGWLRSLGALVGLLNGSLILSFMLQFIYFYFVAVNTRPNPIASSVVPWNLANWAGWFYLGLALVTTLAVALSALARVLLALAGLARRPVEIPAAVPSGSQQAAVPPEASNGSDSSKA